MSIASQLAKMDFNKLKMGNGKTLSKILYEEAQRLRDCIQKRIDDYRESYAPKIYNRTDMLPKSLSVDDIAHIYVEGNKICINLFFENDKVIRESGFGIWENESQADEVNVAYLLNYGYEVKKDVWFKNIENFGYREGYNFVENGIDDFLQTTKLSIIVGKKFPKM